MGITFTPEGRILVSDWNHGVQVLSDSTEAKYEGLLKGLDAALIEEPSSLTFNRDTNNVLIGNSNSNVFKCEYV